MQTNDRQITELMKAVDTGSAQLPDFQRGWVWDDNRIKALIASITNNFPVGAAMFLEYGNADIAATDPVCLDMRCNYTGDSYRYLIFVIEDTFNYPRWGVLREENPLEYVTFNELEVSVKAE